MVTITIKRDGQTQHYDSRKVYASVYNASLNAHYTDKKSEEIADIIENKITKWVKKTHHLNSHQIRDQIIEELYLIDEKDVATLYKHHIDIN